MSGKDTASLDAGAGAKAAEANVDDLILVIRSLDKTAQGEFTMCLLLAAKKSGAAMPNRSHIGDKWSRYQLRSMQLILQATHGVVSGQPSFFRHAFGDTYQEFENILLMPHYFIFNRQWFEEGGGKPEWEAFKLEFARLSDGDRAELLGCLVSSCDARHFELLQTIAESSAVRRILQFYIPMDKTQEALIWSTPRPAATVPDDERVEDAGLNEDAELASNSGLQAITWR